MPQDRKRPYFRSSIADLEQLLQSASGDLSVLHALEAELRHRETYRAQALSKKVAEQLSMSRERITFPPTLSGKVTEEPETIGTRMNEQVPKDRLTNPTPEAIPQFAPNNETKPGPDSVLAAWLTLEVLTPQALPNARELETIRRTLVYLDEIPEPWKEKRFWKRGKERAVHWMVYLGELDLKRATEAILKLYPDEAADERADIKGNTTLAVVVVDAQGRPVEGKTFLSSFAWGYGQVLGGRLRVLAGFPDAECKLKTELEKLLIQQDEDGVILPLTSGKIASVVTWLSKSLNLPDEEVIRPGIAIRVPQWGAYNEPPEPELLNSFFIEDLVKARCAFKEGKIGQGLSTYMGLSSNQPRRDVVREKNFVASTLAPEKMPLARWPAPGRHPLVLMQQAAVNHAVAELSIGGLVGVNGPPGTGKTTLLRDILAKVVLDRAIAMAKFDKPIQAFSHVTSMKTGQGFTHLYKLDNSLLDHEIVVASSNNKAVENISREIPEKTAIADDLSPPVQYFQSISDAISAGKEALVDGATWGLAAAVLGNSANRSAFVQTFWWHKKRGMSRYLKAVLGVDTPEDDEGNDEGENLEKILDVVTIEQPPRSEIEALERWTAVRDRFQSKLKNTERCKQEAQKVYDSVQKRAAVANEIEAVTNELVTAQRCIEIAIGEENVAKQNHVKAADVEARVLLDQSSIVLLRPGFFSRLFGTRAYRDWKLHMSAALDEVRNARLQFRAAEDGLKAAQKTVTDSKMYISSLEMRKQQAETALFGITSTIEAMRKKVGANLADEQFWLMEEDQLQRASPWLFKEWQNARDELFVEAFALHRAFIDAAAKPLRHNLRAAMDVMKGRVLSEEQEPARRSVWASLFMVVPVISTTFASTSRLFGALGREQLGWLLIDEAGQAVPQAAVGALWRAKRAIVIGDPLQIPPVVTTPPKLIRSIFSEFKVNPEEWAAPVMSAQTLADRASWFGTNILTDDGDIWVGSPLRVHRRCENPMFKISNHIAYNGLMVYGTQSGASEIGEILGASAWLHVDGQAIGKWSEAEGQAAVNVLRTLLDEGVEDPDVFLITPFRIVAQKLREIIRADQSVAERLPGKVWDWTNNRVGTVHTFQGKEADTVIMVLGASATESAGARRWAGHPPNILNVAVTRAKRRLYVIGNRTAWKDAGAFSHLAQNLPVKHL